MLQYIVGDDIIMMIRRGVTHFMAKIITGVELKELVSQGNIIQNADMTCAEGIKYDFRRCNSIFSGTDIITWYAVRKLKGILG